MKINERFQCCEWPHCIEQASKRVGDRFYCRDDAERVQELRTRATEGEFSPPKKS